MNIRFALLGSRRIVWRPMPPAPGAHFGSGTVFAQPFQLLPVLAAVGGLEQRRVLHAGVDHVGIGQRRLHVPHPLELPWMRRAVVPLVRAGDAFVGELVADRLPGRAAIVGPLHHLAEPAAGLGRVDAIGIRGGPFQVVHLPSSKEGPADVPVLARRRRTSARTLPSWFPPATVRDSCVPPQCEAGILDRHCDEDGKISRGGRG